MKSAIAVAIAAIGSQAAVGQQQFVRQESPIGPEARQQRNAPWKQDVPFASSHVLVKTMPGVSPRVDAGGQWSFVDAGDEFAAATLANVLARHQVQGITPAFIVPPANETLGRSIGLDRWHMVHVPEGVDVVLMARELRSFGGQFEHAEVDAIGTLAEIVPNDLHFGLQYALQNTGQPIAEQNGVPGADVKATLAWEITTGSSDVVIGVLDAGLDNHDDLAGAIVPGWNTYENNADTSPTCNAIHGTHVSGIAAARGNNGIGVAGMNWQAKVMPVVILSDGCSGTATDCGDGIVWAADNGADIISMSLQYYIVDTEEDPPHIEFLHDAVQYARGLDITVIAAAGNNRPVVAFPGAFPETICVAATNNLDQRASFSNPGPELTIAAPGDDIYSTTYTSSYGYISGTSMATPLVSGLAALMMAVDPDITHDQVQSILISTAEDVDAPGFDNNTGHGRVDAHAALLETKRLLADLNDDGFVSVVDLLMLIANWGTCPLSGGGCIGDVNSDGLVGVLDLLEMLSGWG